MAKQRVSYGFAASIIALAGMAACSSSPAPATPVPPRPSPVTPAPAPAAATPAAGATATATLRDNAGGRVGTATFTDTYAGLLVRGTVSELGLGQHGIHIHAVGKCDPPFTTAGPHFNPEGRQHGFKNPKGPHLGDMPNIDTPAAGRLTFEFLLPAVTLRGKNALLDGDGAAIIIHASRDDLVTDPSGDSGARAACGVIALSR